MPLNNIRFSSHDDNKGIKKLIDHAKEDGYTEQEARNIINKIYEMNNVCIHELYFKIDSYLEQHGIFKKLGESIKVNLAINLIEDSLKSGFINDEELKYMLKEIIKHGVNDNVNKKI